MPGYLKFPDTSRLKWAFAYPDIAIIG